MLHTKNRVIRYKRRKLVRGGGIRDEIVQVGKNGVNLLKYAVVNGVRHLLPIVRNKGVELANRGTSAIANALQHKAESMLNSVAPAKKGGAGLHRNMIMREMRYALGAKRV